MQTSINSGQFARHAISAQWRVEKND